MHVKKILLFMMGILWLCPSYAQSNMLIVWLKSGGSVSYALNERPVIRQQETIITLKTSKVEIEYPIENVLKMTFDNQANSLKAINTTTKADVRLTSDYVIVNGEQAHSFIAVYTSSGALYKQTLTDDYGNAILSLSEIPKGVFIVKSKTVSYKIIKK